jgi:hypothetical protein
MASVSSEEGADALEEAAQVEIIVVGLVKLPQLRTIALACIGNYVTIGQKTGGS